jgi:hypothetical protein
MLLKIDLDLETLQSLQAKAGRELRALDREALALLRQALGLPFPYPPLADERHQTPCEPVGV